MIFLLFAAYNDVMYLSRFLACIKTEANGKRQWNPFLITIFIKWSDYTESYCIGVTFTRCTTRKITQQRAITYHIAVRAVKAQRQRYEGRKHRKRKSRTQAASWIGAKIKKNATVMKKCLCHFVFILYCLFHKFNCCCWSVSLTFRQCLRSAW